MGYIIQDSFRILKEEFPTTFNHYNIYDNDEEVRSFIDSNMLDMSYSEMDFTFLHNVHFIDNKTKENYRAFEEGDIYMLPLNEKIEYGRNINAFSISKELTALRINENGLFIETDDRLGNIVTKYYSNDKLKQISDIGLTCACIDYMEENLASYGIKPSMIINADKEGTNISFQMFEGDTLVDRRITTLKNPNSSCYEVYYNYMNEFGLYSDPVEYLNTKKRIKNL